MGNGRDGLYRRQESPYWYYSWTDATGQRQQRSTRCKLKSDAQAVLERARVDTRAGTSTRPVAQMGFEDLARRYSEVACAKPSWQPVGRWLVAELIVRFRSTPIARLGTQQLQAYQTELAKRKPKPLAPASINRLVGVLKSILTAAVDWGLLPDGHLAQLRRVKPVKGATRRDRYLTDREIARLLIACEEPPKCIPPLAWNPMLRAIITTALATGMRKGEIFRLEWKDIDQARGLVHVRKSKNGEPRSLWVGKELLDELKAMKVPRDIAGGLVFPSPKGGAELTSVQSAWERARARANLKDVHFHDLRHSAASAWAMAGMSLLQIAQLLGHRTMAMVKRYAHLAPGQGPSALKDLGWRPPDEAPGDRDSIVTLPPREKTAREKGKAPRVAPGARMVRGGRYRI